MIFIFEKSFIAMLYDLPFVREYRKKALILRLDYFFLFAIDTDALFTLGRFNVSNEVYTFTVVIIPFVASVILHPY